jgi:hypothetical protein
MPTYHWVWLWFRASAIHGSSDALHYINKKLKPEELELTLHPDNVYELTFKTEVGPKFVNDYCDVEKFPPVISILLSNPSTEIGHQTKKELDNYKFTYSQYRIR